MTGRIDAARDVVTEERTAVRAEFEAFEAFDRRVRDVSTASVSTGPPVVTDPQNHGGSLARVREAYAETVMSAPHYAAEYDDTVAESLAVEFGEDLAGALVGGTALTPEFRDAVRSAVAAAKREREEFLVVLGREDDSLATVADGVADVRDALVALDDRPLSSRGFDDLRALRSRLDDLDARVEGIGLRRQETIRCHRSDLPGVPTDLPEYLYADLPTTYPALAAVADIGVVLDRARRRIDRALAGAT